MWCALLLRRTTLRKAEKDELLCDRSHTKRRQQKMEESSIHLRSVFFFTMVIIITMFDDANNSRSLRGAWVGISGYYFTKQAEFNTFRINNVCREE